MFARVLIRKKLLFTTLLLIGTLVPLMISSLRGVLAYRDLTKSIGPLSEEFQLRHSFGQEVTELSSYSRHLFDNQSGSTHAFSFLDNHTEAAVKQETERVSFLLQLDIVRAELNSHLRRMRLQIEADPLLRASEDELALIDETRTLLKSIEDTTNDFPTDPATRKARITKDIGELDMQARRLFGFMTQRMRTFRADTRSRYHAWIAVIVFTSSLALLTVAMSFWYFRINVVQPFKVLLDGSRRIARGDFEHRIYLTSHDELSELADAQNMMTARFVEIRDNLNEKVQQRTREVVRSEQLASVGFLAAGVAHEINNPLASIAWSAEALESRLHEILHPTDSNKTSSASASATSVDQVDVLRKYLKRIQDEAFRCKGITERLLDFSRLGESQRKQETDIAQSLSDVIALVKHLGQYRNRTVEYSGPSELLAWVSPTEFKQVVLNLLTNSLDASDDGGVVKVKLTHIASCFSLTVVDTGCGMTEEVMSHLFEPFFTRRRDGRGTGLGLSISYRIVEDHGGSLNAISPGPGKGSTFELTMPLEINADTNYERSQIAA